MKRTQSRVSSGATAPRRTNNTLLCKLFVFLCLLMSSIGAWAVDYVISYTANGTTYYLANNGTNLVRVTTFDPTTCIWNASNTLNNTNDRNISKVINGRTYYLNGSTTSGGNLTLSTTAQNFRSDGNLGYYNNRYYYVYYNDGWKCSRYQAYYGSTRVQPYQVTTPTVSANYNDVNPPTISCRGLSGTAGIKLENTGISGSYIPEHNTYTANNKVIGYKYNNTFYNSTDAFKVAVSANDAAYAWSVTDGTASVSNTGVVTLGNNNTQNVTVRCRATINGVNKDATYTLNAAATAALNETAYSNMRITPVAQTLDLREQVSYSVSASISQVAHTRPVFVTITDAEGHTHYKVGSTYQASAPTITETPGQTINLSSVSWSFSGGHGNYYTPSTYYSGEPNPNPNLTLSRTDAKTSTDQTFTITANATYGSESQSASATVTIPLTRVDITNLYPDGSLSLRMGDNESVVGHYTWQPNAPSAGQSYTRFTYSSNNTSVATVDAASGMVTAVGPGSTTITVQSIKIDGSVNIGVSCAVPVTVSIDPPTISIAADGTVTITHPVQGVQIHYTTTGTGPTATTGTDYNGTFTAGNETTVKAVAVANGVASAVVSKFYARTGISGTKVILNDYEDHNWTYYQPNGGVDASYAYPDQLCSPYPRNAKITYYGNGTNTVSTSNNATPADNTFTASTNNNVAVSRYETENTFVYYKTLEREGTTGRFPYELIPNPFSKRPTYGTDGTTKWRGFYGWRIKSISGGTIHSAATGGTQYNAGSIITAEYATLYFQPTDNGMTNANNATSMEVEFEALWARAYRVVGNTGALAGNLASATLQTGVSYERNFVVVNDGTTGAINAIANQRPATIMMIEPDGSTDYRTTGRYIAPGNIIANNVLKIEWCNLRAGHISANNYDMILGRGIMYNGASHTANNGTYGTPGDNLNGNYISTIGRVESNNNVTAYTNTNTRMRVESGVYTDLNYLCRQGEGLRGTASGSVYTYGIVGNDYDRAKNDGQTLGNNTRLRIRNHISQGVGGGAATFTTGNHSNNNRKTFDLVIKSGYVGSNWDATINNGTYRANYEEVVYIGVSTSTRTCGFRYMTMEGGNIAAIAGGCDQWAGDGDNPSTDHQNNPDFYNRPSVNIRIRGNAIVRGPLYAGAANARTYGARKVIMTGGTIKGWLAAGCNGTSDNGGINFGPSYLYVGGAGQVNSGGSNNMIEASQGGNVFGAGSGRAGNNQTGRMRWGTNVVVADDAIVERNVYGGGNMGYASEYTKMFLTGGTVHGAVFGGSNQKPGDKMDMLVTGGVFEGGIYGGSNTTGTINNYVKMDVFGGQIGLPSAPANIHGGGYGQPTRVAQNVDITIGKSGASEGPLIYGDVYGGSALGYVNGETATTTYHTNVTLNAGTINGSLYGGGLGNAGNAANVYGPVAVKVYGGSVKKTDANGANGSGAVYGANNINGAPQRAVTVDVYGTDPAPAEGAYALFSVYGGGNQANYTYGNGYPKVTVHNCDNSIEYVYGGGNAAAVAATDVTIYGGNKIGNVFGGGNGQVRAANVNGNTNVKIYGGTIGDVYGGSNTNGTIGGTINVTVNKTAENGGDGCDMKIGNVYGGGNRAPSGAGTITIGCTGGEDEGIGDVYGGANAADISSSIELNITGGRINNVFGGNNTSRVVNGNVTVNITGGQIVNVFGENNAGGNVTGKVTVNINMETTDDCGKASSLDYVYGGGKNAAYTPTTTGAYPEVNLIKGVVNHDVFGGGLGTTARVTSNPTVEMRPASKSGFTVKGNIYGGGSAAPVSGSTSLTINNGTIGATPEGGYVFGGGLGPDAVVSGNTEVTIKGNTDVNKNVYGGGNGGAILGNTHVVIE